MTLRKTIPVLLAAAMLTLGPAVTGLAEDEPKPPAGQKDPLADTEEAIVKALTRTMEILSRTFDRVLIYELPELLPNGDIIIRRKRPPPPKEPPPSDSDEDKVRL